MFEYTNKSTKKSTTIGRNKISKAKLRAMVTQIINDIDPNEPLWTLATSTDYKLLKALEELTYASRNMDTVDRTRQALQLLMVYLHETISPQGQRRAGSKDTVSSGVDDVSQGLVR